MTDTLDHADPAIAKLRRGHAELEEGATHVRELLATIGNALAGLRRVAVAAKPVRRLRVGRW